jgi:hypothetical protein
MSLKFTVISITLCVFGSQETCIFKQSENVQTFELERCGLRWYLCHMVLNCVFLTMFAVLKKDSRDSLESEIADDDV